MQKDPLFSRGVALLHIVHVTTEVTRIAVKRKCDYQEERSVDAGERWETMEMGKANKQTKKNKSKSSTKSKIISMSLNCF